MDFIRPNSIKNIHKLSIAPMMDCTDKHFRMIMRKISSEALLYTEMIVAQSLAYTNKREIFLLYLKILDFEQQSFQYIAVHGS